MYLVLFALFILIIVILLSDIKRPHKFPPGPIWFPVIGNFCTIRSMRSTLGYYHLVWDSLKEKYGPVVGLRLGRDRIVIVSGVDAIREVFTKEDFDGRPDGFFFRMRTFGKRLGIIFSEGEFWQKQRKFSLQHLKKFGYGRREMEEQITEETKVLIDNLKHNCNKLVQVHHLFDISVINVLWAMMAGQRFNLDDVRLKKLLSIINDVFRSTDISGGLLNQMPFLRFVIPDTCGYNLHVDILKRMCCFLEETITNHKKTLCTSHARDLIDAFLHKMEVNKTVNSTFTDEQLLSLCLDMFMAGSETTSNTLEFAVLYMIKYPEIQKRIQKEMDEIIGRNRWPTLQDRCKLSFVDAVLNEIHRITNVAPMGIAHRAVRDTQLFGYNIPQGVIILTNLYSLHMDEEFWQDPHVFKPDRFLDVDKLQLDQDSFFAPFGYGRRRCLGEPLAKANVFLVFTALFHNFLITKPEEEKLPCLKGIDGVTLSPKPYEALFVPRLD